MSATLDRSGHGYHAGSSFPATPRSEMVRPARRAPWVSRPAFGVRLETSEGSHVLLSGEVLLVGRANHCDIVFADVSVSKVHVLMEVLPGGLLIATNLNSRNGMKLNDTYMERVLLHPGEVAQIGRAWFRIVPLRMDSDGTIRSTHAHAVDPAIEDLLRDDGRSPNSDFSTISDP